MSLSTSGGAWDLLPHRQPSSPPWTGHLQEPGYGAGVQPEAVKAALLHTLVLVAAGLSSPS